MAIGALPARFKLKFRLLLCFNAVMAFPNLAAGGSQMTICKNISVRVFALMIYSIIRFYWLLLLCNGITPTTPTFIDLHS